MSSLFKCLEVPGFTLQDKVVRQPLAAILFSNKMLSKVSKGLNLHMGQNCCNLPLTHRKWSIYCLQQRAESDVFVFNASFSVAQDAYFSDSPQTVRQFLLNLQQRETHQFQIMRKTLCKNLCFFLASSYPFVRKTSKTSKSIFTDKSH